MNPKANSGALILLIVVSAGHGQSPERWIDPRCTPLPFSTVSPLAILGDGRLMRIEGNSIRTSTDDGKTWSPPQKIYEGPAPGIPCESCVLVRTQAGTLVLVYMDIPRLRPVGTATSLPWPSPQTTERRGPGRPSLRGIAQVGCRTLTSSSAGPASFG
jgi:hypothetical protein